MDLKQIDSYQRSNELYKKILLKTREHILETPPSYLNPLPVNEISNTNKMAVIIDPRYDELMEAVILNFMHFMIPEGWIFMIGSAGKYKEQILKRFPQVLFITIDENLLYYDENQVPNITIDNYNNILCSPQIWNEIPCENIAIFQKDCVMYRMFTEDWPIKYAYSGAFWYTGETSLANGVINGGFSLRKKSAMLNCIKHITWEIIELYRKNIYTCHEYFPIQKKNEDIFFTYACEILQYPIAPISIRKQLAIESEYFLGTSVFHGWNKVGYQVEEWAIQILSHSPLFSKYLPEVLASKQETKQEISPQPLPQPQKDTIKTINTISETYSLPIFNLPDKSAPEVRFF
jgi:hypothetical protein